MSMGSCICKVYTYVKGQMEYPILGREMLPGAAMLSSDDNTLPSESPRQSPQKVFPSNASGK